MIKEALKLALEALEYRGGSTWLKHAIAVEAIKAALAQSAQEPVAECVDDGEGGVYYRTIKKHIGLLYTNPPQREWVGLTEEEIRDCLGPEAVRIPPGWSKLTRAIEAKLKERNHGT